MELIAHRRNTIGQLVATPRHLGVEVDIRSQGRRLVIHHDPFESGEDFEDWINAYAHGTLILNTKEEGLERRLLSCMNRRGIEDFFFLDQSVPFLIKTARSGEKRCAVRLSEYEPLDGVLSLAGMVEWVWVDCFTRFPIGRAQAIQLAQHGFKLCIVSPELQGRDPEAGIADMRALLDREGIAPAAVCTKRVELWA